MKGRNRVGGKRAKFGCSGGVCVLLLGFNSLFSYSRGWQRNRAGLSVLKGKQQQRQVGAREIPVRHRGKFTMRR